MKKIYFLLIMALLFHCGVKGKPVWIPISKSTSDKCITITTIESNENRYKAKIKINGYYDDIIEIGTTVYHQLSFDDPISLSFVGEPALPIISRLIALPKGENLDVRILDEEWSEELHVGQVMPRQRAVLETEKTPLFEKDAAIYSGEEYKTERFYIGDFQKWRGINNRALNICPIRYWPGKGIISVLKEFVLDISFEGDVIGNLPKTADMRMFLNQISTTGRNISIHPRDTTDTYDYLIIAGNIPGVLECQALADFRRWKAFKGYKTKVVSTNEIGATEGDIKQYISCEYQKNVRYVLLIGGDQKIPLGDYECIGLDYVYVGSDYMYGCMDGADDIEADICIGRFPANSLTELTNIVNKSISYEKCARNYGNKVLLVSHYQDAPDKYQGCSEAIRTASYNSYISFNTVYGASSYVGGDNGTNDMVVSEINAGRNIINYRGHGKEEYWQNWNNVDNFNGSQVELLCDSTNDVYFCVACNNGAIHRYVTSFMQSFMYSEHGAACMIAATTRTCTIPNNTYNQLLFSKLFNENIYNIGDLNVASHIATIIGMTTDEERNYAIKNTFCYLCGGDPTLEIITDSTKTFERYELTISGQNLSINADDVEGYKVCVVSEGDSLLSVENSSGSSCSFPIPEENCYMVLNKHNYVPRVVYINVEDDHVQNKVFEGMDSYYIKNASIRIGYDVTDTLPYGSVMVKRRNKLNINNKKGVFIQNGFKCELGGELKIK